MSASPTDIDDMLLPSPPGVDENETRQAQIVGWSVAMLVLSFVAVVFRFVSRWLVKNKLQLDDWLALASLPFAWMMCLISIYGVAHNHFGLHVGRSTSGSLRHYLIGLWVFDMVYAFAITLSKLSIMALWWRIFEVRSCHIVLGVLAGAEICWLVAVTLVTVFSCVPVPAFWDLTIRNAHCISQSQFWVGSAVPNIAFDIVLLVLPNFYIARLSISRSQKLAVSFIFMLGTFVTICSGLRLWQLIVYNSMIETDLPWATSTTAIWSLVEGNLSVVCCCLPSMRPLLRLLVHGRVQTTGRAAYYGNSGNGTGSLRSPGLSRVFSKRGSRGNSMMPMKRLSTAVVAKRKTEWWEKTETSHGGSISGDHQRPGSGGNVLEISPASDSWPLPSSNQPPNYGVTALADEKVAGQQQPLSPTLSESKTQQQHSRQSSRNRTMAWPGWIDNLHTPAPSTRTWLQLDDTPADGVTPAESLRTGSRGSAVAGGGNAMKDLEAGDGDRYSLDRPLAAAAAAKANVSSSAALKRMTSKTAMTTATRTSSGNDGDVSELTSSSPSDGFRDGAGMDDVSIDAVDERHEFHAV